MIDASDKVPTQMLFDHLLVMWDELLTRACTAFDLRLLANAFHPLVGTSR